ncbi:ribosome maturation factor RimM [Sulfurospirillum sp. 1612]|uniref:ribosome maturation factor RimM n=1 Tax=Sulfurospirillum sp. 1612 TaxID=3094835 RepID=UPI002F941D2E
MSDTELLQVAKIGRLVGLRGELKLHIQCDFPEQFKPGASFLSDHDRRLTIETYHPAKGTVIFKEHHTRESAAPLVNANLFTSKEDSSSHCHLQEDEFFWFDVIGASVQEESRVLGVVQDIERIASCDYLLIETDPKLVAQNLPKIFYVPYIERYIQRFDPEAKIVLTKDAYGLLEHS